MRLIDLEKYLGLRKRLDIRLSIYYGAFAGFMFFIFGLTLGLTSGLLWGLFMFVFVAGSIFGIRKLSNRSIDRARASAHLEGSVIDVSFNGEFGQFIINDKKLMYVSLTRFSQNKVPDIEINEDLFISTGKFSKVRLQKLKYGDIEKCHITLKEMPNGLYLRFAFYDVDGALEKVTEALEKVNCFDVEKYQ